jgi:uncharacterized protein YegL
MVTVLSSDHGRERRAERGIDKIDLQTAVKYGTKNVSPNVDPVTGAMRWMYTFADVVYVTDETSKREITSWPVMKPGKLIPLKQLTTEMESDHDAACTSTQVTIHWTSHKVIVLDQSGSMRKTDVEKGFAHRSDMALVSLAQDLLRRLEDGSALSTDVVSLIAMNEVATVIVDRQPADWILYNKLLTLRDDLRPLHHGNYLPSLREASCLLSLNKSGNCALALLFLTDGAPSDHEEQRTSASTVSTLLINETHGIAAAFGQRLNVSMIGIGDTREEFSILEGMVDSFNEFGSIANFDHVSLTSESFGTAVSFLTDSLTATKTELTELDGSSQRAVRSVNREPRNFHNDETSPSDDWEVYAYYINSALIYREVFHTKLERWISINPYSPFAAGIALHRSYFGEGAERLVRR